MITIWSVYGLQTIGFGRHHQSSQHAVPSSLTALTLSVSAHTARRRTQGGGEISHPKDQGLHPVRGSGNGLRLGQALGSFDAGLDPDSEWKIQFDLYLGQEKIYGCNMRGVGHLGHDQDIYLLSGLLSDVHHVPVGKRSTHIVDPAGPDL